MILFKETIFHFANYQIWSLSRDFDVAHHKPKVIWRSDACTNSSIFCRIKREEKKERTPCCRDVTSIGESERRRTQRRRGRKSIHNSDQRLKNVWSIIMNLCSIVRCEAFYYSSRTQNTRSLNACNQNRKSNASLSRKVGRGR